MWYFKLFRREAEQLAAKVGIVLPKTRSELGMAPDEFIEDIRAHRAYLNKAKTIWIQPCHYYDGSSRWPKDSEPFSHEIHHSTTESAFTRFVHKNQLPTRAFTY